MRLTVVTPQGEVLDSDGVDEIIAPGVLGEFGVLPGHVPMLAATRAGVLRVRRGSGRDVFAVGPGYAEVGGADRVVVLADACERPLQIDEQDARRDLAEARAVLDKWDREVDAEHAVLAAKRAWAEARLDARKLAEEGEHRLVRSEAS
jgi:F-type H+-transporting ATPase subunit epsilon